LLFISAVVGGVPPVLAAAAPCAEPPYRSFDFWVGHWLVATADGARAGRNHIALEENGCLLIERWQGANGTTGTSLNYYSGVTGRWRQVWVSPGMVIDIEGDFSDGAMRLEGTISYEQRGTRRPFRGTWTPLADGRVRQFFEEDAGDGWAAWFDGYYSPAPPAPRTGD
jgi:hypothetical protein